VWELTQTLHIVGSKSFVAKSIVKLLVPHFNLNLISRENFNFADPTSIDVLRRTIKSDDDILYFASKAPCRNVIDLNENITMAKNLAIALSGIPINFFGYVSSDAVYEDSVQRIDEGFPATKKSLHGLMHLSREVIFQNEVLVNHFLCVRPTLIYGEGDPHNGYGPNRFLRQLKTKNRIEIIGGGEELRDHIYIGDVAQLLFELYAARQSGVFNLCTGNEISFRSLAEETLRISPSGKIISLDRHGPLPHNGYRALDNSSILKIFPNYKFLEYNRYIDSIIVESSESHK
jgi:nucleoside-diphosphate-sugar epimerase